MNPSPNPLRRGLFAIGAVVATLAIAACGSSGTSSSTSSSAAGTPSASTSGRGSVRDPAQRAKLVACLEQHGVTLPSGPPAGRARGFFGGAGGLRANPKLRAALRACGAGFRPGSGRFNSAARKAQVNKFVACVRKHGYDLPKPNFSGHGSVFPSKIQSDPKFQAASKSCASLLRPPAGQQGAPGGGPPPSSA